MTIHTSADDDALDAAYLRADEARTAALEAARNARYARADALHAKVKALRREAALERLGPCADCAEPRIDGSPRCSACHVRYCNRWSQQPWWLYGGFLLEFLIYLWW